ncbi:MAG: glycerate kinase [Chloroflexota bacterium]
MEPVGGLLHRAVVMEVLQAALAAADPYRAVLSALTTHPIALAALTQLTPGGRVYVVGAGKAGTAMTRAAEEVLGERVTAGLVIVKDGHTEPPDASQPSSNRRVLLKEASHPVPDARGVAATVELLDLVEQAGNDDLVLCLISGGGSALLTAPAEGITLEDVQSVTAALLRAGATINELNAVRKHLSRVSGGQLARIAAPANVLSLILSDVTGSPLDVIASGPTVPDTSTFGDALAIILRYNIADSIPLCVPERLRQGTAGDVSETPKPGDPLFNKVANLLVANNVQAVEAAADKARLVGLNTGIISTYLEGEARIVGGVLAGIAREVVEFGRPVARPACLLFGGETTVTVRGNGVGGRNSELALGAALALAGLGPNVVVASLATDGGDGSSPGAGGIVDGTTIDRGHAMGLNAEAFLANNDSYTYLAQLGDAIMTGPTGTNVNDIMALFVLESS